MLTADWSTACALFDGWTGVRRLPAGRLARQNFSERQRRRTRQCSIKCWPTEKKKLEKRWGGASRGGGRRYRGEGAAGTNKKTKKQECFFFFLAYSPRRQEGEGPEGGRKHPRRIQGQLGNTKHSASEPSRTHGGESGPSHVTCGPTGLRCCRCCLCGLCSER